MGLLNALKAALPHGAQPSSSATSWKLRGSTSGVWGPRWDRCRLSAAARSGSCAIWQRVQR